MLEADLEGLRANPNASYQADISEDITYSILYGNCSLYILFCLLSHYLYNPVPVHFDGFQLSLPLKYVDLLYYMLIITDR